MRVLVTRPIDDARRTARRLAEAGHEAIVAPQFEVRFLDVPLPALDGVQAILATSGNGMRALARCSARRDIQVFAVGTQTAARARAEGFPNVVDAAGDAKALALAIRARLLPEAGAILHAMGMDAPKELEIELGRANFDVRSCVLYEMFGVRQLPETAASALREGSLDAVLVFSPRSAQMLADLVCGAGLSASCGPLLACCISKAAAEALDGLAFAAVRVADKPDQDSLISLLDKPATQPP